jgi:hippurate hydrolase
MSSDDLQAAAREQLKSAIELRRRIHRHPELGLHLPETRQAVLDAIEPLGVDIELCQQTSGVIATLRGARPGRRILLRADMDALPMPEDTGLDFASTQPGRMHACGHDAHTAMLVGAAKLLAARRDTIEGEVKLFFQPGEEGHFGAREMLAEGLLEGDAQPDAVFAIHIDPRVPTGRTASRGGAILASTSDFEITLTGKGGHASMPHDTLDPIPVACEIVTALQSMVTRRINAFDPAVLTIAKIESGSTYNVIPETAKLIGTLRATSEHAQGVAEEGVHRVVQGIAAAHGLEARVDMHAGYPVTVNDVDFERFVRDVAEDLMGPSSHIQMPSPAMGAEDFSYLLQRWPGAMVFLGLRDPAVEKPAPCHSNRMMINEEGMVAGMALHAAVALRFLAGEATSPPPTAG